MKIHSPQHVQLRQAHTHKMKEAIRREHMLSRPPHKQAFRRLSSLQMPRKKNQAIFRQHTSSKRPSLYLLPQSTPDAHQCSSTTWNPPRRSARSSARTAPDTNRRSENPQFPCLPPKTFPPSLPFRGSAHYLRRRGPRPLRKRLRRRRGASSTPLAPTLLHPACPKRHSRLAAVRVLLSTHPRLPRIDQAPSTRKTTTRKRRKAHLSVMISTVSVADPTLVLS